LNRDFTVRIVSLTQAPLSAAAAAVTGLAAFAAVAMDAGWQFVRHGTVMAHEGAHAVLGSLAFRKVSGVTLNADATGATDMRGGGCLGGIFIGFAGYAGPSLFGLGAARLIPETRDLKRGQPERVHRRVARDGYPFCGRMQQGPLHV